MANNINKRIFDTDNALKGSFNGICGKWQITTYSIFVFSYAVIIGWINHLLDYTLITPRDVQCNHTELLNKNNTLYNISENSLIQRLSGKNKYEIIENLNSTTIPFAYNYSTEFGQTVITEFNLFCDLQSVLKMPRFANFFGFIIGCLMLGLASDKGGRKIIILACIWTSGVISIFQLVGNDFISFVFFQFFIGLFIGGVQASFLPAIIEMFPINFRAFYGVFFHLIVVLFELLLPWLGKSFKSWSLLQVFVTAPVILTAILQWFVYESIFWYLAHKEYDKAIEVLTDLAKRNGIQFESKFKQAKDFLHAKHSKGTQVDILPLLRLQDVELFGKK
jgi:hypothetical protein